MRARQHAELLFGAIFLIAFLMLCRPALAQPASQPTAAPAATSAPQPSDAPPASAAPAPSEPLPAAGIIPANITLDVTGTPVADPTFLDSQIRDALSREIRPTLRPGSTIAFGAVVPWPLQPLAAGARTAVSVSVSISGDESSAPVAGQTTVLLENVAVSPRTPGVLFLDDDPEYLRSEGLLFRGSVSTDRAARLYYYHSDVGVPRDLDVVVTASAPARVQLIASTAEPELDVMNVGHSVSRDFLQYQAANEGTLVDVVPGKPFVLRHALLLQGEVVAGAVDFHVLSGTIDVSVIATPAGGHLEAYLNGPRVGFDGHGRHGVFDLDGYGSIAATYTVGGPDAVVKYGGRAQTPRNLNPSDVGRDYGDYGILHRITFTLANPTDVPHTVYFYEKPLAGPVRSSFLVDGQFKELGCVRTAQPYWLTTYQLAPHSTGASTTITMPDGGSFYPLEIGVTETQPQPFTPPLDAPDGCRGNGPAVPDATAARDPK